MAPDKVNVPLPTFVRAPKTAVDAPEIVNVVPEVLTSIIEVFPAVRVKLRLVEAVDPVYLKVPPSNTRLAAAFVACPKFPATPPFPIVATLNVPALIVVAPVYVFVPDNVNIPDPSLVNVPVLIVIGSGTVIFPDPPKVKLNVPVIALPLETSKVNVSESELILDAEA